MEMMEVDQGYQLTLRGVHKREDVDRYEHKQRQIEDPCGGNEHRWTVAFTRVFHGTCARPVNGVHEEEGQPDYKVDTASNPLKQHRVTARIAS